MPNSHNSHHSDLLGLNVKFFLQSDYSQHWWKTRKLSEYLWSVNLHLSVRKLLPFCHQEWAGLISRTEEQSDTILPSINYFFFKAEFIVGFYTHVFSRNKKVHKYSLEHRLIKMLVSQLNQTADDLSFVFIWFLREGGTVVELLIGSCGRNCWSWFCMSAILVNLWKWIWVAEKSQFHVKWEF